MIFIQINGRALDIPDGTKLSFERQNNMLSTTLRAARSAELSIPRTRTNCDVFGIQSVLQLDPLSERAKGANKQSAFVSVDGYALTGAVVYLVDVSNFDTLKICVVYDALFSLLGEYKDAKLKDLYAHNRGIYTNGGGTSAFASVPNVFSVPLYLNGSGNLASPYLFPSVNLYNLLTQVETADGSRFEIDLPEGEQELQRIGVLPEKIDPPEKVSVTLAVAADGTITDYSGVFFKSVASTRNFQQVDGEDVQFEEHDIDCFAVADDVDSVDILFPYDFPDDVFLIQITPFAQAARPDLSGQIFHGDYNFNTMYFADEQPTRQNYGVPLRGRKITIDRVTEIDEETPPRVNFFTFVRKDSFKNEGWYDGGGVLHERFGYSSFAAFSTTAECSSGNDGLGMLAQGKRIYLADNLPDWSVLQTLQILCEVRNMYITAEGGRIVLRRRGDFNGGRFELKNVLSVKVIRRRFKDYAQRNVVRFDSEDSIAADERLAQVYDCDSNVLDAEKELYVIAASEGVERTNAALVVLGYFFGFLERADVVTSYTLNDDGEPVLNAEMVAEKPCIHSRSADTPQWAKRVDLQRNTMLAQLCDNLQEVDVNALCSFWDFQQLKDNTLVLFEGVNWVWSKAVWSEGKVTLTLHRL